MMNILFKKGGNAECVQLLIEAGANVDLEDIKGQTPLFVANSLRKTDIMEARFLDNS